MTKVYACLTGKWVCLNDDPNSTIGDDHKTPQYWWEEKAPIYSPIHKSEEYINTFYGLDYVHIYYEGKDYRINPIFIQIVTD